MDRTAALAALPAPYGMALRLRDSGETVVGIADATGVPVDAVPALLEVGDRKLAVLLHEDASEPGD